MKIRQKQVAAALAAVEQYLQEEEAAAQAAPVGLAPAAGPERVAAVDPGHWAQAARMEAMSMRRMMQMRAFSRAR